MSLRFQRRKKILPGVWLNFSKKGVSASFGVHGAKINVGKRGTYLTSGIPGTGLSERVRIDGTNHAPVEQTVANAASPVAQKQSNAAFVLGIVAVSIAWIPIVDYLAIIPAILAVIIGASARSKVKLANASTRRATIGLVTGILSLVLVVFYTLILVVAKRS